MNQLKTIAVLLALSISAVAAPIGYSAVSGSSPQLYRIDLSTGVATALGALTFNDNEGIEMVNGVVYSIGGSTGELWNITSAPGTLIGSTGARLGIDAGLGYNPVNGTMYNLNGGTGTNDTGLYTVNLATGAATLVATADQFADNLAIDSLGNAYAIDGVFADSLFSVNLTNGAFSLIGGLGLGNISVQFGSAFDQSGTLWALSSVGSIYTINTATGAATFVAQVRLDSITGAAVTGFEGLAIDQADASGVPEPATYASVIAGLAAVVALRRRRA